MVGGLPGPAGREKAGDGRRQSGGLSLSSLRWWQPSGGPAEAAAAAQVHAEAATHCLVFFYSCLVHAAAVAHCF